MTAQETNTVNAVSTTLASTMAAGATSFVVTSAAGFPTVPFYVCIDPDIDAKREYMLVNSSLAGTTASMTATAFRNLAGSAGDVEHDAGAVVRVSPPMAQLFTDINDRVDAVSTVANAALPKAGGTMTAPILAAAGSAAAPGVAFDGFADIGLGRSSSTIIFLVVGSSDGVEVRQGGSPSFRPMTDDNRDLGEAARRWDDVYATNGTIQTSDERAKADVADLELGLDFLLSLRPIQYRMAGGTRPHAGLSAQQVKETIDGLGVDFAGYIDPSVAASKRVNPFLGEPTDEWIVEQASRLVAASDSPDDPRVVSDAVVKAHVEWESERAAFDAETTALLAAPKGLRPTEWIAPLIKANQELHQMVVDLTARVKVLESART